METNSRHVCAFYQHIEVAFAQSRCPLCCLFLIWRDTKSDYCQVCGFDGEIEIKEDPDGKLVWTCPQCGNTDQSKMNVARRTCGYIGTQYWNQGRTQEIRDRVLHL